MIYEAEVLTSWKALAREHLQFVPFAAHLYGIRNWQDATGCEFVPPTPPVVIVRTLTDGNPEEIIDPNDRFNLVLWCDIEGDTLTRRDNCTREKARRIAAVIDEIAGKAIGADVVDDDFGDLAMTVLAWRLKMWIRTLPRG